ncbi:hypothetical protein EVAR_76684_1 [Eumeta japonica]|uniref:Uncharacterized protein n=1 Tax=Eumeta variegata TaxID=151549 RepID=A0A4C1SVF7_EUMVA|nr:hypothetical protein EVAR_76684_1 [Eumeta japonica]
MSLRRLLVVWRSSIADNLLRSLLPIAIVGCLAITSPSDSAKSFALFPGWSLAGLVGKKEGSEPGVKPYTGRRIANDTLRMVYYHDQTVAVVELGPEKLLLNCELIET